MDDDFDLFPKRENLDPFSFGTKDKKEQESEDDKEPADLIFDQDEARPGDAGPGVPDEGQSDKIQPPDDKPLAPLEKTEPEIDIDAFADLSERDSDEIFGEASYEKGEMEPSMEGPIPDDQSGYGPRRLGRDGGGDDEMESGKHGKAVKSI